MLTNTELDMRFVAVNRVIEGQREGRDESLAELFSIATGERAPEPPYQLIFGLLYPMFQLQSDLLQAIYHELVAQRHRECGTQSPPGSGPSPGGHHGNGQA